MRSGQKLEWAEDGDVIFVIPVADDPIRSFRVPQKEGSTKPFKSRQVDARRI